MDYVNAHGTGTVNNDAIESAIMGNATGLVPGVRGMRGHRCAHVKDLLNHYRPDDFAAGGQRKARGSDDDVGALVGGLLDVVEGRLDAVRLHVRAGDHRDALGQGGRAVDAVVDRLGVGLELEHQGEALLAEPAPVP